MNRWVPLFIIVALFYAGVLYLLPIRLHDWRYAVFNNADVLYIWNGFSEFLSTGRWTFVRNLYVNTYGYLYFYVALVFYHLFNASHLIQSVEDVYGVLRITSLLSSIGCLFLYFRLQTAYRLPSWFGYVAILLTLSCSDYIFWSYEPKPDLLQYFFLLAAMCWLPALFERGRLQDAAVCCIFIGLAAATKLTVISFFPAVVTADLVCALRQDKFTYRRLLLRAFGFAAIVVGVYLIFNLHWIFNFSESLSFYRQVAAAGRPAWAAPAAPGEQLWFWGWFLRLWDFGWFFITTAFAGMILRAFRREPLKAEDLIMGYSLFFVVFIDRLTGYQSQEQRVLYYLFPILPGLFMAMARLVEFLARHAKMYCPWATTVLVSGIIVLNAPQYLRCSQWLRQELRPPTETVRYRAGAYLTQTYPAGTRFLRTFSWWVPAAFENDRYFLHIAPTLKAAEGSGADVILISEARTLHHVENLSALVEALHDHRLPYRLTKRFETPVPGDEFEVFEREGFKTSGSNTQ